MFKPVSNKVAFPKMEEEVLAFWESDKTFEKSLKKNEGGERYKFYDGPPFATGLPHYGHLLAGRIRQDISRDDKKGLEMFVSGDQLLRGAALNAVEIAEHLVKRGLV